MLKLAARVCDTTVSARSEPTPCSRIELEFCRKVDCASRGTHCALQIVIGPTSSAPLSLTTRTRTPLIMHARRHVWLLQLQSGGGRRTGRWVSCVAVFAPLRLQTRGCGLSGASARRSRLDVLTLASCSLGMCVVRFVSRWWWWWETCSHRMRECFGDHCLNSTTQLHDQHFDDALPRSSEAEGRVKTAAKHNNN